MGAQRPSAMDAEADDSDPLTSDDEANELLEANRKPGEVQKKVQIKRSEKEGKKTGKGAGGKKVSPAVKKNE